MHETVNWQFTEDNKPQHGIHIKEIAARAFISGYRSIWGKNKEGGFFIEVLCTPQQFDVLKEVSYNAANSYLQENHPNKYDKREYLNADLNDLVMQFYDAKALLELYLIDESEEIQEEGKEDLDLAANYVYDEIKRLANIDSRLIVCYAENEENNRYIRAVGKRYSLTGFESAGDKRGLIYFSPTDLKDYMYFKVI